MLTLPLAASLLLAVTSRSPTPTTEELAKVAAAFKVEVRHADPQLPVKTRHGKIEGKAATADEVARYAPLFVAEFSLYPPELVKKCRLERVVLCTDLSFAGQRRTAVPDFEHDTLYLDVARGMPNTAYLRKVLHHEFFHIIDLRDDGSLKDDGWAGLNAAEFEYGTGGKSAQDDSRTSVLSDKAAGFLNHYSTTAVEEDKAEVFAHLVAAPEVLAARAEKDRVLGRKAERMKKLLADFCPQADDAFWEAAGKLKRGK
jgi:hypothetical protein